MSDMKSEDLKDQAKEKINAINARIWKSCRNKKSYLATLIKHLAKECHLLSLANIESTSQLKKERKEATTSREELKEWFDLEIQFKADLRKMKAENDRYKDELDEALGNVEEEENSPRHLADPEAGRDKDPQTADPRQEGRRPKRGSWQRKEEGRSTLRIQTQNRIERKKFDWSVGPGGPTTSVETNWTSTD
jgi:hypothetical protein